MSTSNPNETKKTICKILGVDPSKVSSIRIDVLPDAFPTATIQMIVEDQQLCEIAGLREVVTNE